MPLNRQVADRERAAPLSVESEGQEHDSRPRGWRRYHTFATLPILAAIVVGLVATALPKSYRATASFYSNGQQLSSGLARLAQSFGSVAGMTGRGPEFYADLIVSSAVLRALATTPLLNSTGRTETPMVFFEKTSLPQGRAMEETVAALSGSIRVRTNKTTGVVSFDVLSRDPVYAAAVARRVMELVNDFNVRTNQSSARATREFLERRQAVVRSELTDAEDALQVFERTNRLAGSAQLQLELSRLRRRVTLKEQAYLTNSQQLEEVLGEEVRSTPVVTTLDAPTVPVKPASPRPKLYGAIAALLTGMMLVAREVWRRIVDAAAG